MKYTTGSSAVGYRDPIKLQPTINTVGNGESTVVIEESPNTIPVKPKNFNTDNIYVTARLNLPNPSNDYVDPSSGDRLNTGALPRLLEDNEGQKILQEFIIESNVKYLLECKNLHSSGTQRANKLALQLPKERYDVYYALPLDTVIITDKMTGYTISETEFAQLQQQMQHAS